MTRGRVHFWNGERGFGQINRLKGAGQVFVDINRIRGQVPLRADMLVEFREGRDGQGRPYAFDVHPIEEI